MLSHRGILFTAAIGGELRNLRSDDRIYGVLPMSHIVGFSSVLAGTLMCGACLVLVPRFDAAATLASLRADGITRFQGVPTMYQRLLDACGGRIECPALRTIGVAGAPLDQTLKDAVEAAFGLTLDNGYGITECSPTIAFTRSDDPRQDTTVGPCIPGIDVRLRRPDGADIEPGDVGELHVRGPNVMLGYYRAPDLKAAAIDADGWFNTGDLARFDGPYLHIVGRTKELIIRSGFNVYPPEVEAVLASHPAIAMCAVVGRKVPGNEEVVAIVQLRCEPTTSLAEISAYAAKHLAPYKRPAEIIVRQTLPTTSAGKIVKHELAREALHHEP
jgi:long-chain acyl-CoA synthetase